MQEKDMSITTNTKSGKFTLPANLSFRRSVDVSDGLMSSVMADGSTRPVEVTQITVRGAMANSTAGYDKKGSPLVGDALEKAQNPTKPNIQSIDRAALDPSSDTLDLSFSMAFHGGGVTPDACSKAQYRDALAVFVEAAGKAGLYEDLAARYLWNVVNGRVLWRNACGLPAGCTLKAGKETLVFDWGALRNAETFPGPEVVAAACSDPDAAERLVSRIARALAGGDLLALDVSIRVSLYKGAEVWPSQEFVEKSQKVRDGREISRVLSSRTVRTESGPVRQGTVHSQKIGNAVRTIDEWHGSAEFGAIPVEAFGWVQRELTALRAPSDKDAGLDAYRALDRIGTTAAELSADKRGARELALYTLAILVRGGVFGVSEKEEAAGGE
jgi:CRISPR-associated protein Csy3